MAILSDIKSLRVRNFEFDSDGAYSREDVESVRKQLSAPGWSPLIQSHRRDPQEDVDIYVNTADGKVLGLAVIASEPRSFTIVSIIGSIDIDKLAKIEGQFGIPRVSQDRVIRESPIAVNQTTAPDTPSLLLRARGGDASAFESLVRMHQSSVFSIGYRMLNRRDAAEDLAQDVFLQLYRRLDSIESLEHCGYWLRRVAANLAIDWLRHAAYTTTQPLEAGAEIPAQQADHDPL
jgi:hypothetical protein